MCFSLSFFGVYSSDRNERQHFHMSYFCHAFVDMMVSCSGLRKLLMSVGSPESLYLLSLYLLHVVE